MLLGLCAICVGVYGALDRTTPAWVGTPMLVVGVARLPRGRPGRRPSRRAGTRYRPAPWLWPETVVAASGLARRRWRSGGCPTTSWRSPTRRLTVAPTLSLMALAAAGIGLGGALCAPHRRADRAGGAA